MYAIRSYYDHLQGARWFIKSLMSRNETILRVATKIVEYQRGFFEHGEEAMKPLVLRDIAEARITSYNVCYTKLLRSLMGVFGTGEYAQFLEHGATQRILRHHALDGNP